jgi:pimeloyl-ACP methyl ester carboxylesterase
MLFKRFPIFPGTDRRGSNNTRHIAYTEWGEPDNPHIVVCVHGLTRNCRDFDFLAHALAADCRVICVDVAGCGQSDWLANGADYGNYLLYLSDAVALLKHIDALDNDRIQLDWVGVSVGGLIGMMLAIQPEPPPGFASADTRPPTGHERHRPVDSGRGTGTNCAISRQGSALCQFRRV